MYAYTRASLPSIPIIDAVDRLCDKRTVLSELSDIFFFLCQASLVTISLPAEAFERARSRLRGMVKRFSVVPLRGGACMSTHTPRDAPGLCAWSLVGIIGGSDCGSFDLAHSSPLNSSYHERRIPRFGRKSKKPKRTCRRSDGSSWASLSLTSRKISFARSRRFRYIIPCH